MDFKACRLFGHRPRSPQIINLVRIIMMRTSSVTNIVIKCTFSIDKLGRAEVHAETGTTVEFFVFIFVLFWNRQIWGQSRGLNWAMPVESCEVFPYPIRLRFNLFSTFISGTTECNCDIFHLCTHVPIWTKPPLCMWHIVLFLQFVKTANSWSRDFFCSNQRHKDSFTFEFICEKYCELTNVLSKINSVKTTFYLGK